MIGPRRSAQPPPPSVPLDRDPCIMSRFILPPLQFSMARLDSVKNLTGLVEWFGKNARLRELCNLVIVGGNVQTRLCKVSSVVRS